MSAQGLVTLTLMLPVLAMAGSIFTVCVPVVDRVCVAKLKLLALEKEDVRKDPSGLSSVTVTVLMVLLVSRTVTCWFDVPLKVREPFWPGIVVVTFTAEPPTERVPVMSGGTS